MPGKFYAVGHGFKRGVYENWNDVKKQIDNFPMPVYKKFDDLNEAEKFVEEYAPKEVILDVDESSDHFYAVARGRVVGLFTDYNEAKKHTEDYHKPLLKKFTKLEDAHNYYKKFALGEAVPEEKDADEEANNNKSDDKVKTKKVTKEKEPVFYAVARGYHTGVFNTWAECQKQTKDLKGAKFKKFDNEDDAKLFAESLTKKQIEDTKRKRDKVDAQGESHDEDESPAYKNKQRRMK